MNKNPWNPWANWYHTTDIEPAKVYRIYARGGNGGLVMFEATDMSLTDALQGVRAQGFKTPLMVIK